MLILPISYAESGNLFSQLWLVKLQFSVQKKLIVL